MDLFSSCFLQLSSAYGLVRLELEAYPSLWRDPAKQRLLSKTARMAPVASPTLSRSLVRQWQSCLNLALLGFLMTCNIMAVSDLYIAYCLFVCFCLFLFFWTCFAGDYEVSIKFNDEHIPDSPFVVPVASPSDDARRLTVASLQVRLRGRQTFVHPQTSPRRHSAQQHRNSATALVVKSWGEG